jgi:23S rRNA (cytosine1962-C5)-methyltransferase
MSQSLQLKSDKEHLLESRHPWIFSGALAEIPSSIKHGEIVKVRNSRGAIVATGTFSKYSNIAVRVFSFGEAIIDSDWLWEKIEAIDNRKALMGYGPDSDNTGYRVVFGEADGIPGLVVDKYEDVIVTQMSTAGIDKMRDAINQCLINMYSPSAIVDRSDSASRKEEKLEPRTGTQFGDFKAAEYVEFLEEGIKLAAHPIAGQKTGFYLDQRDTRKAINELAAGRSVLNLFSYTGANGIAALLGQANRVLNIDSSNWALEQSKSLAKLNGLNPTKYSSMEADVFKWLDSKPADKFEMVIMDPPALIKSQDDIEEGRKAYHFINRAALRLVKKDGLFITSSCSQFFTLEDFATTLRRSSVQNGISLQILRTVPQSPDHPISLYFPESNYLKTFVCQVG